ncbi:MAG: nucleotide-binding protein [Oscillospiraceae bacterium]|nr:nucleotide-binding protein [Oscillospiraceae bacterium]
MLAHSVKEMETWLVEADKSIKDAPIHNDTVKTVITRKRQIEQQYELLRSYITSKLTYYRQLLSKEYNDAPKGTTINNSKGNAEFSRVFIVHGHNGEIKEAVARLIEKQGIQAIILHEQANQGATIIEKFEKNSNVGGAVCLFTADDLGHAKSDPKEMHRARQNVVFETGYFIGKLGREKVVLVADKGVEIPSDLQGVVYTETASWQYSVLKELKAIGYDIDYNKLD